MSCLHKRFAMWRLYILLVCYVGYVMPTTCQAEIHANQTLNREAGEMKELGIIAVTKENGAVGCYQACCDFDKGECNAALYDSNLLSGDNCHLVQCEPLEKCLGESKEGSMLYFIKHIATTPVTNTVVETTQAPVTTIQRIPTTTTTAATTTATTSSSTITESSKLSSNVTSNHLTSDNAKTSEEIKTLTTQPTSEMLNQITDVESDGSGVDVDELGTENSFNAIVSAESNDTEQKAISDQIDGDAIGSPQTSVLNNSTAPDEYKIINDNYIENSDTLNNYSPSIDTTDKSNDILNNLVEANGEETYKDSSNDIVTNNNTYVADYNNNTDELISTDVSTTINTDKGKANQTTLSNDIPGFTPDQTSIQDELENTTANVIVNDEKGNVVTVEPTEVSSTDQSNRDATQNETNNKLNDDRIIDTTQDEHFPTGEVNAPTTGENPATVNNSEHGLTVSSVTATPGRTDFSVTFPQATNKTLIPENNVNVEQTTMFQKTTENHTEEKQSSSNNSVYVTQGNVTQDFKTETEIELDIINDLLLASNISVEHLLPEELNVTTSHDNLTANSQYMLSGALISVLTFGLIFSVVVTAFVGKKVYDSWTRRHYSRVDYLVNGMYN